MKLLISVATALLLTPLWISCIEGFNYAYCYVVGAIMFLFAPVLSPLIFTSTFDNGIVFGGIAFVLITAEMFILIKILLWFKARFS